MESFQNKESHVAQKLSKRIPEIDGLRGLAILAVLVFHLFSEGIDYAQSHPAVNYIAQVCKNGSLGVELFFVISGFLIGGILIDNRESTNYFKTFYLRRIFRIFPLYYALIFIFYVLSMASAQKLITVADWMVGFTFSGKWYLTFTQNFPMARDGNLGAGALAPTWPLAIEEQFYLTLPFIIFYVPRKLLSIVVIALIFMAPIFRAVIWYQTSNPIATKMLMPGCLDALMVGVLIALTIRSNSFLFLIKRCYPIFIIIVMLLFSCLSYLSATINLWIPTANPLILMNVGTSLFFGMLVVLAAIAKPEQLFSKFLSNKLLRKIGEMSYFVYLFHIGINMFVRWQLGIIQLPPFGLIWLIEISLTLIITLFLAKLSWKYFEKPLVNFSHRFTYVNS